MWDMINVLASMENRVNRTEGSNAYFSNAPPHDRSVYRQFTVGRNPLGSMGGNAKTGARLDSYR
jgi:hypothetical protein